MKHLILVLGLLVAACTETSNPPPAPTTFWGIYYSVGMSPTLDAAGGFAFPQAPGSIHYVLRRAVESGRTSITMRFRIEGGPFKSTQDGGPAFVSLIVERNNDTLAADHPSYRFYAGATVLIAGEFAITVPLTADHWTNVFGHADPAGFAALLGDLGNVGFVFGNPGAGATGHGVDGSGRFTLLEYTLN